MVVFWPFEVISKLTSYMIVFPGHCAQLCNRDDSCFLQLAFRVYSSLLLNFIK